ncbi:major facilitator superfamily domain-containing protein [Linnemannia elongata]|nr:major facilitator superfamily domain-containing protein [Linnemannia elongata]
MVHHQHWQHAVTTQEREPLLANPTHHDTRQSTFIDRSSNSSGIESRRQNQPFNAVIDDQEGDDDDHEEARWFAELRQRPWPRRPSMSWLVPWVIMHGINSAMCDSPLEQLKIMVICGEVLSQQDGSIGGGMGNLGSLLAGVDECKTGTVLSIISLLQSRIRTVTGICVILTLAKWCSLSDVYGRKFLFQAGMAGIALYISINIFAATRFNVFGSSVYYLEAVVAGCMPMGQLINPAIFAYCADVVPRTGRSLALGLMVICLAVGNTIGSVLGAYLARNAGDLTVVLRLALILTALLSVYLSVIPESLRKPSTADAHPIDSGNESEQEVDGEELSRPGRTETSRSWTIKSIFVFVKECLAMITDPIALFLPEHIPKSKNIATSAVPMLVLLVNFLSVMGHRGANSLFITMTSLLFHWTAYDDYIYMIFSSLCLFVIYMGILPVLQSFYRAIVLNHDDSEEMDVSLSLEPRGIFSAVDSIKMDVFFSLVGLCALILSYILVPIFSSVQAIYIAGALKAFGIIALISVISLITSMMPQRLTGSAVGALSVSDVLAGITADLIYGPLFSHTLRTQPLLYYFLSAGLFTLALVVQYAVWRSYHRRK